MFTAVAGFALSTEAHVAHAFGESTDYAVHAERVLVERTVGARVPEFFAIHVSPDAVMIIGSPVCGCGPLPSCVNL